MADLGLQDSHMHCKIHTCAEGAEWALSWRKTPRPEQTCCVAVTAVNAAANTRHALWW